MCTLALIWKTHAYYPLILAGNRDEYYERLTRPACIWPDGYGHNLVGGKDLEADGSWLLVTLEGRWAALTNYRDGRNMTAGEISRGELVKEAVQLPLEEVEPWLVANKDTFAGYNLLWGTKEEAWYFTNAGEQAALGVQTLKPGVYILSNANLNTPWFKTQKLAELINTWLHLRQFQQEFDDIFLLLANKTKADPDNLPNTHISKDLELFLSSIYIEGTSYGTRCSSLLYVDKRNHWTFREKTHAHFLQNPQDITIIWSEYEAKK